MKKRLIPICLLSTITLMYTVPVFGVTKAETVYSKINSKGEQYKTIVSTKLDNTESLQTIEDLSTLLNIENTNGEETFTQDGNLLKWNADGKTIYYKGESENSLPVKCEILYKLNGEDILPEDIVGKEGKVEITLRYVNNDCHYVQVNGKTEKMYTPFVVTAGTIIQNENNENIEVTNGKLINDGTKTIIMGIAMPGLQESLKISKSDIEIPDYIKISMDTKCFELNSIISYITPKIVEESDLSIFNRLDELYSKTNTLQESSNKLQEGSETLKTGTSKLLQGTTSLKNGVSSAKLGTDQIRLQVNNSVSLLKKDTSPAIDNNTLVAIKNQANQAAIFTNEQKIAIANQAAQGATLTEEQKTAIANQAVQGATLTEEQKTAIANQAVRGATLTEEQKQAIASNAENNIKMSQQYQELTEGEKQTIGVMLINVAKQTAITTAENTTISTAKEVSVTTAQSTAIDTAKKVSVTAAQNTAIDTAKKVSVMSAQNIATKVATETAETTAIQVASTAKKTFTTQTIGQLTSLSNGLGQLYSGINDISLGTDELNNGTDKLNNGAEELANGMEKFNTEGIQTICNYINNNVKNLSSRLEALKDLASKYNNFTGINSNTEGIVKFIVITDELKKQD